MHLNRSSLKLCINKITPLLAELVHTRPTTEPIGPSETVGPTTAKKLNHAPNPSLRYPEYNSCGGENDMAYFGIAHADPSKQT